MEGDLTRRELLARMAALPLVGAIPAAAKAISVPKASPAVEPFVLTWRSRDRPILRLDGTANVMGWEAWSSIEERDWRHDDWTSPVYREFKVFLPRGLTLTGRQPDRSVAFSSGTRYATSFHPIAWVCWPGRGNHMMSMDVDVAGQSVRLHAPFVAVGGNSVAELDGPSHLLRMPDRIDFLLFAERE